MSPDPAGLAAVNVNNPQTWNQYAYVRNLSTILRDPLGLMNDCGGICVPFSQNLGNGCTKSWDYYWIMGTDGIEYQIPEFNITCAEANAGGPISIGNDPRNGGNGLEITKSDARIRCDNGLLTKTLFAGLASSKASAVNTAEYAIDKLHELFSSKSFQAGAGASVATVLTEAGATDVLATTAGAATSEVLIPLGAAALAGYTLYEGYKGARDYWNEHQNDCNSVP